MLTNILHSTKNREEEANGKKSNGGIKVELLKSLNDGEIEFKLG